MRSLPPGGPVTHEPSTRDAREVLAIFRRHRWLLLVCPLVGAAVGLALASLRKPTYEASALIVVGNAPAELASAEVRSLPVDDAKRIGTEMELLRSRRLASEVVDSLALQVEVVKPAGAVRSTILERHAVSADAIAGEYHLRRRPDGRFTVLSEKGDRDLGSFAVGEPIRLSGLEIVLGPGAGRHEEIVLGVTTGSRAVRSFAETLEVEQPTSDVNAIRVSYSGSDPELVRDVPNALTDRYMALRDSIQKSEARSTAAFLREQLETISRQLATSEDRLQDFRESSRVIDPQVEANSQLSQVAQLEAERSGLEAERSSLARAYAEVTSSAGPDRPGTPSPYRRLMGYPSLLRNESASELLRSLNEVENQLAALASRRTAEDPEVQILNARVVAIEAQLQGIVSTYLRGLSDQIASMDATLGRYRAQLNSMPAKEIQFFRLSREPRVLQATYELLQTRLQEARIAEAVDDASVRVVDRADLPSEPTGPGAPLFAAGFGALGLVVGVGLMFAREYGDQSVHNRADVQAAIGIPVLGVIPIAQALDLPRRGLLGRGRSRALPPATDRNATSGKLIHGTSSSAAPVPTLFVAAKGTPTPVSDAYNRLHTNIMFAQPDAEMKTLLFTSPLPGDGKTNTAANLAVTLAQSGLKVLLIDADLRRGRVHEIFGTSIKPGLAELLANAPAPGVLRSADVGRGRPVRYIASGEMPPNPVELLSSLAMRALLEGAAQEYDRVIIDTPPLNLFPDAAVLSPNVDGVIVVARAGVTPFDALVDTAEQLRHTNTRVVGAVLNGVDFERDVSYDTSYRWYQYGKDYAQAQTVG